MAISPGDPDSTEQVLPDGWIRTPLPPEQRVRRDKDSWFGRTGEPAPSRMSVAPVIVPNEEVRRLSQGVLLSSIGLVGVFAALMYGGIDWWFA